MKLGIVGLAGCGKSTVFEALTRSPSDAAHKGEPRIGTVRVPDERIDTLSEMYRPQKTTYAQVEYFLPGKHGQAQEKSKEQSVWTQARDSHALLLVVRNFTAFGGEAADPAGDLQRLNQELMFADLVVVEKKLERLDADKRKGKKVDAEEHALLRQCHQHLEAEVPLRTFPELAAAPILRGYTFLSAKPALVLFNNADEDEALPAIAALGEDEERMVIRGKLEQELAQMSEGDAAELLAEFGIKASAMDRVIKRSYALLGLISFFTVGDDEVRAWTITSGTGAMDAAEVIHSDLKKGFIRAEVMSYDDLIAAGSEAECKKRGTFRLEGKTYVVKDGDVMSIRFNV